MKTENKLERAVDLHAALFTLFAFMNLMTVVFMWLMYYAPKFWGCVGISCIYIIGTFLIYLKSNNQFKELGY